jgi:two-component system, OmpR family, sensor histidine kinase CiaH
MARLTSHRTALILYAVLLVLPAVAFGSALWIQLDKQRRVQLEDAPVATSDAALRLERAIRSEFLAVLGRENDRDIFEYQRDRWQADASDEDVYVDTILESQPLPTGVLGWFRFDMFEDEGAFVEAFVGARGNRVEGDPLPVGRLSRRREIAQIVRETIFPDLFNDASFLLALVEAGAQLNDPSKDWTEEQVLLVEMAMNMHASRRPSSANGCSVKCMRAACEQLAVGSHVNVRVSPMRLHLFRDELGTLQLLALRRYFVPGILGTRVHRTSYPEHLDRLLDHQYWTQGIVLDPTYFFKELPKQIAEQILPRGFTSYTENEIVKVAGESWETSPLDFLSGLNVESRSGIDRAQGRLVVATNVKRLEDAFRVQTLWFFGVAGAMIVSLALGLQLLLGSLRQSQEQARRTENFVAAVTHELRTPIAAVRMYSEMLRDGWVSSQERQDEYLSRIVKETHRLGALVDRVIDKRRLNSAPPKPEPGDLNSSLRTQRHDLGLEDGPDVVFELQDDLPQVWMTTVGIHAVLQNLVENALKYAPVDHSQEPLEPILVRTRLEAGQVLLEVLDRGPGIAPAERKRVFEAFYRPGSEQTRTAQGTGLGLHLVEQYAKVMRAQVHLLEREGGGTVFQVAFRTLKRS